MLINIVYSINYGVGKVFPLAYIGHAILIEKLAGGTRFLEQMSLVSLDWNYLLYYREFWSAHPEYKNVLRLYLSNVLFNLQGEIANLYHDAQHKEVMIVMCFLKDIRFCFNIC